MFAAVCDFVRHNAGWICVVWLLGCALVALFMAGARRARPHVEPSAVKDNAPSERCVRAWEHRYSMRASVQAGAENGMGC